MIRDNSLAALAFGLCILSVVPSDETNAISGNQTEETPTPSSHATVFCASIPPKDLFLDYIFNESCQRCEEAYSALVEKTFYSCGGRFRQIRFAPIVHVMNASMFTSNQESGKNHSGAASTENWCMIVNFYASYCPFSARLAPFYNALPRAFPTLFVAAVDATQNSKVNLVYGISGTPTLLLFHNGRPVARYEAGNYSVYSLIDFVKRHTDLLASSQVDIEDEDFLGPLPSTPSDAVDYYLVLAWCFIVVSSMYYFCKSSIAQRVFETLKRNWREMEGE